MVAAVLGFVLLGAGVLADPQPAAAATIASRIEAKVLALVNEARANRGLDPLRTTAKLVDLAGDRARHMASTLVLKHPACLPCKFRARDIPYSAWGETIAWTYGPWAARSGRLLFRIWKNSPPHWSILMSPDLERIGVGVARASNGAIYGACVLTS
jgi:uncharacterized protein YkwD